MRLTARLYRPVSLIAIKGEATAGTREYTVGFDQPGGAHAVVHDEQVNDLETSEEMPAEINFPS